MLTDRPGSCRAPHGRWQDGQISGRVHTRLIIEELRFNCAVCVSLTRFAGDTVPAAHIRVWIFNLTCTHAAVTMGAVNVDGTAEQLTLDKIKYVFEAIMNDPSGEACWATHGPLALRTQKSPWSMPPR